MKAKILNILVIGLIIFSFSVSGVNIAYNSSIKSSDNNAEDIFNMINQEPPLPGEMGDNAPYYQMVYQNDSSTSPNLGTLSVSGNLDGLIFQIDESTVHGYITTLEGFGPRVTGSPACSNAGDYIFNVFQGMGLDVRKQHWSSSYYEGDNIEGTIYGVTDSDEIYIVCGHYDSVSGSPGADDNAAGTSAVLAAAEVMSNFNWDYTVRFVAFDGEEQGLYGSYYYAQEAASLGDNIVAVLNADMIGFALDAYDRSHVKVYSNSASHWIVDLTTTVSQEYNDLIDLTILDTGSTSGSDHYSFWNFGYDAVFYHEYNFNDYYHSPQDTSDKLDMDYDMRVTRLIMATLGELAVLSGGSGDDDDDDDDDDDSDYIYIPPFVRITNPYNRATVNKSITITGNAFDYNSYIKYVYVKIGDGNWLEADLNIFGDGLYEWSIPWDTTTVEDGQIIISAVSINRNGVQSPAFYSTVTVQNEEDPEPVKYPDLKSTGSLKWSDIKPKLVIQGEFIIENIGDSNSELDWEISDTPNWGDWTFTPSEGYDLTPEDGSFTIEVQLVAPEEKNQNFSGEIKVVNKGDSSDYNIIPVSLSTSKNKVFEIYPLLLRFLEQHPLIFPLLRYVILS